MQKLEEEAVRARCQRILRMRETVRGAVPTPQAVESVVRLIAELRNQKLQNHLVEYSPGPRAAQTLLLAGKVASLLRTENQGYTFPSDIVPHALPALRHRLILNFEAEAQQQSTETILKKVGEMLRPGKSAQK